MLKTLLSIEMNKSAEDRSNIRYDLKNGRLGGQSEIIQFLSNHNVSVEALPPDLQTALKKNKVVGVLASQMDRPTSVKKTEAVSVRLESVNAMLLAWERELFGSGGGPL